MVHKLKQFLGSWVVVRWALFNRKESILFIASLHVSRICDSVFGFFKSLYFKCIFVNFWFLGSIFLIKILFFWMLHCGVYCWILWGDWITRLKSILRFVGFFWNRSTKMEDDIGSETFCFIKVHKKRATKERFFTVLRCGQLKLYWAIFLLLSREHDKINYTRNLDQLVWRRKSFYDRSY